MFRAIAAVLSLLASSQVSAQHRSATPQTTSPPLVDEIVVVGRRSGPPLWKVSSGKHLLWILGSPDLVPKDLDWLSDRVLETLGDSQEYLLPPSFGIQISGPIAAARAWKKVKQSRKNADNATLEEVLPAPLYELFSETKQLYAPKRDDLEELRPSYAADKLFDQATRDAGLISDRRIRESLKKQAKRNGVRIVWSSTYAKLKSIKFKTIPSRRSPSVMSQYPASPLRTLRRDFSSRTPVWVRSTSLLFIGSHCYIGTKITM